MTCRLHMAIEQDYDGSTEEGMARLRELTIDARACGWNVVHYFLSEDEDNHMIQRRVEEMIL